MVNKEGIAIYEGHVKGFGRQLKETLDDHRRDFPAINKHNDFNGLKNIRYISVYEFIVVFKKTFLCYPWRISQLIILKNQ